MGWRQADLPRDGKPEHLIEYGKQSAQALGVDSIDLLYLHRHDPEVPYNESCEGIKALLDQALPSGRVCPT